MSIALSDIQRLASLARIELVNDEAESIRLQLNRLFTLIEQIQQVKTDHIPPLTHPIELMHRIDAQAEASTSASASVSVSDTSLRLREDKVTETVLRDEYQHIAPATERGLYIVPKVIE